MIFVVYWRKTFQPSSPYKKIRKVHQLNTPKLRICYKNRGRRIKKSGSGKTWLVHSIFRNVLFLLNVLKLLFACIVITGVVLGSCFRSFRKSIYEVVFSFNFLRRKIIWSLDKKSNNLATFFISIEVSFLLINNWKFTL